MTSEVGFGPRPAAVIAATITVVLACSHGGGDRGVNTTRDSSPDQFVEMNQKPSQAPPLSSRGISADEDAEILPGPPGTVVVSHDAEVHSVEWSGTRDDRIAGYQVYRRCSSQEWVKAGFVKVRADDERNRAKYRFEERLASDCEYTVAAVGANGVAGPMSIDIQ